MTNCDWLLLGGGEERLMNTFVFVDTIEIVWFLVDEELRVGDSDGANANRCQSVHILIRYHLKGVQIWIARIP